MPKLDCREGMLPHHPALLGWRGMPSNGERIREEVAVKMRAGTTPNGFGLPVHLVGLAMIPPGIRRELNPL